MHHVGCDCSKTLHELCMRHTPGHPGEGFRVAMVPLLDLLMPGRVLGVGIWGVEDVTEWGTGLLQSQRVLTDGVHDWVVDDVGKRLFNAAVH